jgi:Beta-lactamase class C and other penicillin binding proteins
MVKRIYIFMLLLANIHFITSCNSGEKQMLIAETTRIASEAKIPLIQFEFGNGNHTISFESSQNDTIVASGDENTIFQAASLSKPIFAYIVLRMYDRGEIGLDTPICEYTDIDRFVNKEWAQVLTPRIVLSHKTGLPNWAVSPSSEEWPTAPIEFAFRPDSAFGYSGEGYAFLQRAVEKIKGRSLQQIAEEEVFIPFGMELSSYGWRDIYDKIAANGYDNSGENRGKGRHPRENSAYTLRTTAHEYSLFIRRGLIEGVGLKPESHRLMLTPQVDAIRYSNRHRESDNYIDWGLGVGIEHNSELGEIYYHWGDNGNFKALFVIVPKENKYLTYFTNSTFGHNIIDQITPLYFGNAEPLKLSAWISE